jgi:pyruvate formate lyase activating enzyme
MQSFAATGLDATTIAHELGIHIELTYLIIPGENDTKDEIRKFAEWVADLEPRVPVHFTPISSGLQDVHNPRRPYRRWRWPGRWEGGRLQFIYLGNVALPHGEDTVCPKCHHLVVERSGFGVMKVEAREGHCPICGQDLYMVQRKGEVPQSERRRRTR